MATALRHLHIAAMTRLPALFPVLLLTLLLLPAPSGAMPTRYFLDAGASRVEFSFTMGGGRQNGIMPVADALIIVDPDNLAASRVDISLDVAGVRTPLPFVKPALIGPNMLDAAQFPGIRFVSTRIQLAPDGRLSGGAKITGMLTIRDVTRPVTLAAGLFRAPASAPDDLSELTIHLVGEVSRSAFGANGFGDLVADTIGLNVSAVIRTAGPDSK